MIPAALPDALGGILSFAAIMFFRLAAIVSVMPGVGTSSVPTRIKLGVAITLALFFAALLYDPASQPLDLALPLILTETLIGLAIGLALRFMVFALQTAGTIAAQSTSLSQIMGNAGMEPMPAIGHVLVVGGVALMFVTGAHLKLLGTIVAFYKVWPVGTVLDSSGAAMWMLHRISESFTLAFRLAVPFVILSMLYNVTLGVINKAMPQLMVSFVGAPVITLGGMIFLAQAAPQMLDTWRDALDAFLLNPLEMR